MKSVVIKSLSPQYLHEMKDWPSSLCIGTTMGQSTFAGSSSGVSGVEIVHCDTGNGCHPFLTKD